HQIICISHGTHAELVCILSRAVNNLLCLFRSSRYDLVCLCICLLHDFMITYKLVCLCFCFLNHRICLCLGICKDCVFIIDDLLITLDLFRRLHSEFSQQLVDLIFVHNNLCRG